MFSKIVKLAPHAVSAWLFCLIAAIFVGLCINWNLFTVMFYALAFPVVALGVGLMVLFLWPIVKIYSKVNSSVEKFFEKFNNIVENSNSEEGKNNE